MPIMLAWFLLLLPTFLFGCFILYAVFRIRSVVLKRQYGVCVAEYTEKLFGLFILERKCLNDVQFARNELRFGSLRNSVVMLDSKSGSLQITQAFPNSKKRHRSTENAMFANRINAFIDSRHPGPKRFNASCMNHVISGVLMGGLMFGIGGLGTTNILLMHFDKEPIAIDRLFSTSAYDGISEREAAEIAEAVRQSLPDDFPANAFVPEFCRPDVRWNKRNVENRQFRGATQMNHMEAGDQVVSALLGSGWQPEDRIIDDGYIGYSLSDAEWRISYSFHETELTTYCYVDWRPIK